MRALELGGGHGGFCPPGIDLIHGALTPGHEVIQEVGQGGKRIDAKRDGSAIGLRLLLGANLAKMGLGRLAAYGL